MKDYAGFSDDKQDIHISQNVIKIFYQLTKGIIQHILFSVLFLKESNMRLTFDEVVKRLDKHNIGEISNIAGKQEYVSDMVSIDVEKNGNIKIYCLNLLNKSVKHIFNNVENVFIIENKSLYSNS